MPEINTINKSARVWSKIQEISKIGAWELDHSTNIMECNPRVYEIFQIDPSIVVTKDLFYSYCDPQDRAKVAYEIHISTQKKTSYEFIARIILQDGEKKWIRVIGHPNLEDETLTGYYGTLEDITDQKILESRLNEVENKVGNISLSADGWSWEVDRDLASKQEMDDRLRSKEFLIREINIGRWELNLVTNTLHWSFGVFEMFELDPNTFYPSYESFLDAIHPEDRGLVNRTYLESLETKTAYSLIHRLLMPDGRVKWVKEQCNTIFSDEGKPLRSMGIIQDISDLQAIQEELLNQKFYLESITESLHASTIVSIADRRGIILSANPMFCETSKFEEHELLGKKHNIINSGYHEPEFWKNMWKTISKGKTWRAEVKNRAKDGSYYWVDTTINPILNREGKVIEYLSIRNLITDKKESEFALDQERKNLSKAIELINQEIKFAETIQNYLLPSIPNWQDSNIKVHTYFKPLDRVSGDIYDFFQLTETKFRFFIADATGHGLTAGFQTMSIQTEYQRVKTDPSNPCKVLSLLNESIHNTFSAQPIYYTCCLIDIDIMDRTLEYASAGHPEPILLQNNEIELLTVTCPILGLLKDPKICSRKVFLSEQFRLILYTDGITETHNKNYDIFDTDELLKFIEENPNISQESFTSRLETTLARFRDGLKELDDATMILIDYKENLKPSLVKQSQNQ